MFRKDYFAQLKVVGQFNLGFIVAHLGKDVFIVDQHATDEKFNYERLKATTKLKTQSLITPLSLDLSAQEQDLIADNLAAFERNGFKFRVQLDHEDPHKRIQLIAKPFSKGTEFGVNDIHELVNFFFLSYFFFLVEKLIFL